MGGACARRRPRGARAQAKEASKAPEKKKRTDIEVFEEDDEFEEFMNDDWDASKEDAEDQKLWQDDWDDDDIDDDFCRHLREELAKAPEQKS